MSESANKLTDKAIYRHYCQRHLHATIGTFAERKTARTIYFWLYVYGWRLRPCSACSGSGRYDHSGSPPCSSCGGTGRERYRSNLEPPQCHVSS